MAVPSVLRCPHGLIIDLGDPCPYCERRAAQVTFQHFWRCAHHPSAISNFFARRTTCAAGCHATELRWHDNGTHPSPLAIWSRSC